MSYAVLQDGAQALDGAVQSDFGRARANAEQCRDLGMRVPLHLLEHEDEAEIVRRRRAVVVRHPGAAAGATAARAGTAGAIDRYVGYYEPYATSHDELDGDEAMIEEVRNVARAVANAVSELRAGRLVQADAKLQSPRPK